jgi:two-component system alkaline phosphatase synthesis response regulator PhoP
LYFLASHSGQSWSRQQLIEKICGWNCDDTGEEQVVSVHISQIRKKMIQVDATGYGFINTIGGYGYRFIRPIARQWEFTKVIGIKDFNW